MTWDMFPFNFIAFITLILTLATAIIAANCLVLVLMWWQKSLRALPNIFLGSLAVSDLISGLVGIPLCIACFGTESLSVCVSSALFVRFTAISSVCHLLLIAVDRYTMIVHSMQYESIVTKQRSVGAIFITWLLSLVASVLQLSWYELNDDVDEIEETTSKIDSVYFLFCLVVFFAVPLCLMIYLYGRVFVISVTQIQMIRRLGFKARKGQKSVISNHRGGITLVSMLVVFSVCWLPFFIVALLDHVHPTAFEIPNFVNVIILFLRFSVPLFNPLLCTFGKRDFSAALRRLWVTRFKARARIIVRYKQSSTTDKHGGYQEGGLNSDSENPASPRIVVQGYPWFIAEMTKSTN